MVTTPYGKGVILIGGTNDDITGTLYQLNCEESGCKWDEMEQKLKVSRSLIVAFLIPLNLTNCTKN
jgi:hypothetical protein